MSHSYCTLRENTKLPRLIWSALSEEFDMLTAIARNLDEGGRILVQASYAERLHYLAPHLKIYIPVGNGIARYRGCERPDNFLTLLYDLLPSQVKHQAQARAVTLDIFMDDLSSDAWDSLETQIIAGLTTRVAASALVGTPHEIAQRLADYLNIGILDVVLTAPVRRAPYEAVQRKLIPLLEAGPIEGAIPPHRDRVLSGVFAWNGRAL